MEENVPKGRVCTEEEIKFCITVLKEHYLPRAAIQVYNLHNVQFGTVHVRDALKTKMQL